MLQGFPPIIGPNPRILILGSMPSVSSLQQHAYYAHPQNAFWPIMARLFDFDPGLPYEQRCLIVAEEGIAIWDVIKECQREGSLDAAIDKQSLVVNDFDKLFHDFPQIKTVGLNGGMAEATFKRHCRGLYNDTSRSYIRLPSSSPANARLSLHEKVAKWHKLLGQALV